MKVELFSRLCNKLRDCMIMLWISNANSALRNMKHLSLLLNISKLNVILRLQEKGDIRMHNKNIVNKSIVIVEIVKVKA